MTGSDGMPSPSSQLSLHMCSMRFGSSGRPGPMPLEIAVGRSGRDVVLGVPTPTFARHEVLGGALEAPYPPQPDSMGLRKFLRLAFPHWVTAVIEVAALDCEGSLARLD